MARRHGRARRQVRELKTSQTKVEAKPFDPPKLLYTTAVKYQARAISEVLFPRAVCVSFVQ